MKNPAHGRRLTLGLALALALVGAACAASDSTNGGAGVGRDGGTDSASMTGSGGFTGLGGSVGTGGTSAGTGGLGTGGAFSGTGGASAGGAGGAGGFGVCGVTISPVSPTSFVGLESGPDVKLRVMATVRNGPATPTWTWTVMFQAQTMPTMTIPIQHMTVDNDPTIVEFPIAQPGRYDIAARVDTAVTCPTGHQIAFVTLPSPSLVFRVTPPPTVGFAVPPQDVRVGYIGGVPSTTVLNLTSGTAYSIAPQEDEGHTFISSYVRISGLTSGVVVEGYTAGGPVVAFLLPSSIYNVLVIPDGLPPSGIPIAPTLFSAALPVSGSPLVLDHGTAVTGTTFDPRGAPLSGVRIVLRDGVLPSTVGVSRAAGAFSLFARSTGSLSAVMVPPTESGLPEAHVSASPGIKVVDGLDLQMTWAPITQASLSVSIKASDGSNPVAGAAVRAESAAELVSVGTLMAQSTPLAVTGSVHVDVVSDDAGVARFSNLPVGNYIVTAVPPLPTSATSASAPGMVLTTTSVSLGASGYAGALPMALPVKLTGTLLPANIAQGARVTAYDKSIGITTAAVSTIAAAGGTYTLLVAPGLNGPGARKYQLVADPPVGVHLARTVLGTFDVSTGDMSTGSLPMAAGVPFAGKVQSGFGVMGGAFVQVFCSGAACVDPKTPVAEAVTQQDGTFTVVVPVPAAGP